jgi:Protein of unknown function (DUF2971)
MIPPKYLYKYENFSAQALENLKNQSLYFASPRGFNDPYDCALHPSVKEPTDDEVQHVRNHYLAKSDLPPDVRRKFAEFSISGLRFMLMSQGQNVLDAAVQEFLQRRGVTCFSEKNNSLLMWAHYGGRYKGFCLEFRADAELFRTVRKVKYEQEMPQIDIVPIMCGGDEADEILNLYCTKALDWQYEQEWRCIHKQAGIAYSYPSNALTGVYIGPDANFASFEIIALIIANQNPSVKLWQGHRSKSEFQVDFELATYVPYLEAKRQGLL